MQIYLRPSIRIKRLVFIILIFLLEFGGSALEIPQIKMAFV